MKKFVALILAVVMVFALAVTASAATIESVDVPHNKASSDVTITVSTQAEDTVYYVEVNWGTLAFSYTHAKDTWNPLTHSYTDGGGSWSPNSASVTVKNHSNASINYKATSETDNSYGVTINVTPPAEQNFTDGVVIARATSGTEFANAPSSTFTVSVSGTPNVASVAPGTEIGTVTVTIAAAP